ncbi:helix-turn-helix transcriptional regulator [Streptomyces sp. NPDC004237]|uniref:response regulator transcription factor n=1 Tax=Streptomyces sp. NPDC004237 TaxID=3154455 RepID=UPI00339EF1BE
MIGELTFPWARAYDDDQLAAFIEDLWGAAGGGDDLSALDAIEKVIAEHRPADAPVLGPPPCPLTVREVEILTRLGNGDSYDEAAHALGIAVDNLRGRITRIFGCLGARNRGHAMAIAVTHGWLPDLETRVVQPPSRRVGPHSWKRFYQEQAERLRDEPGAPMELGPYTAPSGARRAARCIEQGLFAPFAPAGAFTATPSRSRHGYWWVVTTTYVAEVTASPLPERTAS